jgi:RecA-family ATPase
MFMQDSLSSLGNQITGITASKLMEKSFPEIRWAIPGILPEGASILGGKPKTGKSMFSLNTGIDIASGNKVLGHICVEQGIVLYFALEDPFRRLQDRLGMMLQGTNAPEGLILYNNLQCDDSLRFVILEKEIKKFSNVRLVVIDTLAMFNADRKSSGQYNYEDDYKKIVKFKEIADNNNISILLVHHLRKMGSDDVMDTFLGTQGLTGAADGLLAMVKGEGQSDCNLIVKGRDIEEATYALKFNPESFRWNMIGTAQETKSTPLKQKLYDALKQSQHPLSPKFIAERTGLTEQYVKNTLPKLMTEGGIMKADRGQYIHIVNK